MFKKILLKRVLPICLALAVLGGMFWVAFSETQNAPGGGNAFLSAMKGFPSVFNSLASSILPGPNIISDGTSYPINRINAMPIAADLSAEELLPVVGNRETLLKLLLERGALYDGSAKDYYNYRTEFGMFDDGAMNFSGSFNSPNALEAAPAPQMAEQGEMGGAGGGGHSQTNEQVEGVSEGDIVKTDGRYIYAMTPYSGALRIIRADGANMNVVSTISNGDIWGAEFYLIGGDRLAIVGSEYVPITALPMPIDDAIRPAPAIEPDYYDWRSRDFTILLIYDISDRTNPTEVRRVSMDGWSVSTRVIGDIVYLVTNKNLWSIPYDQADSPSILPYCFDALSGDEYEPISFDRIYYIPDTDDSSFMLIGAINVYNDDPFEPIAYLGASSNLYMSQNAMYVTKLRYSESAPDMNNWRTWREMTDILRFAINGTDVTYTGAGTVDGSPINQYSMDEHNGYFRIATTDWNAGTYVTVLDASDMTTVGRTEPLAPGETMRSMRFMGDMGYVVTFENVDPLFTIDLSNPYNPKMLGELKIPGFSQYLHPIGDGLLLGIGRDTQEIYTRDANGRETVIGFRDMGMKLSVFDVSNPFDPKEKDVLSLGDGWAEVSGNPRALMCDRERDLYGFIIESWNNNSRQPVSALLLNVENGRLSIAASLTLTEYSNMYGSRLCFIGNTLYYVYENGVDAYDFNSFEKLGGITF